MFYCKICGRIYIGGTKCDCCGAEMHPIPPEYLDSGILLKETENRFIEEVVKTSPEFDADLFERRPQILADKRAKADAASAYAQSLMNKKGRGITCPYCQAKNASKISTVSKAASIGFFGLFSNKIGKQWHCNSCNSNF